MTTTNRISPKVSALRLAIRDVLAMATEPLTSPQIAGTLAVQQTGASIVEVSNALYNLMRLKRKAFPLKRLANPGKGQAQWQYYNPTVIKPLSVASKVVSAPPTRGEDATLENTKVPEFHFNPWLEQPEPIRPGQPDEGVVVTQGVKAVTVTVGGVVIRIELEQ